MSGGVAYVYDPVDMFDHLCNTSMVKLERIAPSLLDYDQANAPKQSASSVENNGMGDMLSFDAERLRILIERHYRYTGSARAKNLLETWDHAVTKFVKVMPVDYARALNTLKDEKSSRMAAAE